MPVTVRRAGPGLALGLALGLLALGPGLRRGFLLSYDMVFVPREPFTSAMFGLTGGPPRAVPSDFVIAVASRVVPADITEKLVLLLIFVLACSGAAALLDREPLLARLAAGTCYAWNPYVAERLIIGQWALLLGYAGLPWVLRAVLHPGLASWRGTGRLALALLPAVTGGFAAMAITALTAVPVAFSPRAPQAPQAPQTPQAQQDSQAPQDLKEPEASRTRRAAVTLTALAVGSLPWLIPSVLRTVYADPAGVAAFAARADTPFGTIGSLLMLGGMWNADTVPRAYGGAWSALWLAVALAAIAGYVALSRRRWPGLGPAALAGLVIAGIGVIPPGRDLLRAAIGLWPGFAVLRDGQQFVAPLALAEAVGLGLAASWAMYPGSFGIKKHGQPGIAGQPSAALPEPGDRPFPRKNRPFPRKIGAHRKFGRRIWRLIIRVAPIVQDLPEGARTTGRFRTTERMHTTGDWNSADSRGAGTHGGGDDPPSRGPDAAGTAIGVVALLAPILLLPGLAWGAAGRLRPAWYPAGYLAAARMIDSSPAPGDVLLLPWAAYRTPPWNHDEVMLDAWPRLLSRPVIWNDGTQVGDVTMAPDYPAARRLDRTITGNGPLTGALRQAGVRFVIVDSGPGPGRRLPGCAAVITGPGLVVYEVPGSAGPPE